jgi:hypothetical protein
MTKLLRFLLPWFHWETFRKHSGPTPQGCVGSLPPHQPESFGHRIALHIANTTMVRR